MIGRKILFCALCSVILAACGRADQRHSAPRPTAVANASVSTDAGPPLDAQTPVDPHDTARALAALEPTVAAESGADGVVALSGRADLWEHGQDVTLRLEVMGCKPGATYPARIQAGSDCSAQTLAAEAWPAGEGIDTFACTRTGGAFLAYYARTATEAKPWTIGGPRESDVVGHALVLFDAENGQPVACGVIERAPAAPLSETNAMRGPSVQIRAAIAGVCVFDRLVPKVRPDCPDYAEAVECASAHCELDRCIDACAAYVKCMARTPDLDVCVVAYTCEPEEKCSRCQSEVVQCEQDVCLDKLSCAGPTRSDGACNQLKGCCNDSSDDAASCLDTVDKLARFGGDAECQRLIDDWNVRGDRSRPCLPD